MIFFPCTTNKEAKIHPKIYGQNSNQRLGLLQQKSTASFDGLAVLESTLPSISLSYKIQHNEAAVAVLTVLAVLAVMVVSVMTATPLNSTGASFFGIEMSFLWYRGGLSLLFGVEIFFGMEILHSVVQHLDRFLPGINLCVLFGASKSCQFEVKKISILKRRSKNLDTPKKTSRYQLKESPKLNPLFHDPELLSCKNGN